MDKMTSRPHFGGTDVTQLFVLPAECVHQVWGADHQQPAPGHLAVQDLQRAAGGESDPERLSLLSPLSPPPRWHRLTGWLCFLHKIKTKLMTIRIWAEIGCCSVSWGIN